MSREQFERLARRLLREAGFVSATVTGKAGDEGIDGIGVYRLSPLCFPVFFQCKRFREGRRRGRRTRLPRCHEPRDPRTVTITASRLPDDGSISDI
jgi:hypothetical protein